MSELFTNIILAMWLTNRPAMVVVVKLDDQLTTWTLVELADHHVQSELNWVFRVLVDNAC